MSLPDINFEKIRPFDGSRHAGFEEMCCQLVYLEPASSGKTFHRKGHGGDAGVECYRRRVDGTEVGWQAKYLFHWNDGLKAQLDNSIRTALDKHPHLVEYVVCLPFNLSDSRTGKGKTARTKWDTWCTKWEEFTATQQRHLTITLWGKSELSARLAREDPAYSGRLLYWFGTEAVTSAWFNEKFERQGRLWAADTLPRQTSNSQFDRTLSPSPAILSFSGRLTGGYSGSPRKEAMP